MTDAFDANVLIAAARPGDATDADRLVISQSSNRIGSVVLLPEVLTKPLQTGDRAEIATLTRFLASIELKSVDVEIADAAVALGAKYRLKAADAIHLATAVVWGAERFYTHDTKDFGLHITEIDVVRPGAAD
ncbi:PIN domain-containing protein [Pseudolysinimonas sp.]|uniref:type II toxin-antitoxin system VapC family toxin n=1 Tax=Pseudolysinimonas sp. TaxID=2680009 RepID=UPI00286AAAC1|nr:PIN domain-containing protein [Pseudolysinimonas sp.]